MKIRATGGRVLGEELLEHAEASVARANLSDLVRINRWFGGHRIISKLVGELAERSEKISLLDVGAASGDMGAAVRRTFPNARVVSVDLKLAHLAESKPPRLAADAFALPFGDRAFDVVYCSLFLHHFSSDDAGLLLKQFHRLARRAVIVIDLERSPLPYYFMPATRWLFRWGDISVYDGKLSVEAAWKPDELQRIVRNAGLPNARVRRHLPWFRISAVVPVAW